MMSNKGFTLIEVLVATIILFFSILTVNAAYKQYASYKLKQQKYEDIYTASVSLMNKIEGKNINLFGLNEGEINGIKYSLTIKPVASKRNFAFDLNSNKYRNMGRFLITLYKIEIKMANRTFVLYKTGYRKIR